MLYITFFSSRSVTPDDNPVDALDIEEQGQQQVNDNLSEQVDANDDTTENENLQPSSQPENSIDIEPIFPTKLQRKRKKQWIL